MRIRSWSATDVGLKRDHNEDSHLIDDEIGLYIVADGMGGHAAGEKASRLAIETISATVMEGIKNIPKRSDEGRDSETPPEATDDPLEKLITDAVRNASAAILNTVEKNPNLYGMGTTVSALLIHEGRAFFGHVGDSRIYKISEEGIKQVTNDHSLVQEQVDAGIITKEEAERSHFKNIITRSVGFEPDLDVDTAYIHIRLGDRFLICSDGLSNPVRENELYREALNRDGAACLRRLIEMANERGGDDNITGVLLEVTGDDGETHDTVQIQTVDGDDEPADEDSRKTLVLTRITEKD